VALAVGYAGQSAFGTVFRRVTGTPPSAWRRERML
jgi:AraC-like DNA-binding protein